LLVAVGAGYYLNSHHAFVFLNFCAISVAPPFKHNAFQTRFFSYFSAATYPVASVTLGISVNSIAGYFNSCTKTFKSKYVVLSKKLSFVPNNERTPNKYSLLTISSNVMT